MVFKLWGLGQCVVEGGFGVGTREGSWLYLIVE